MNQEEIKALIPHRDPFLFIDSIVEADDEHLVATRTISGDEPQFQGHYPGNPIMPGVLLCEAIFQAAAVYMAKKLGVAASDTSMLTPVLARIQDARFKQMVKPGDEIVITVTYKEPMGRFHFMKGAIKKDGKPTASVEFALAMIEAEG